MADVKFSALTTLLNTEIAPTDVMPIVDVSAGASGSKQVPIDTLFQSILQRVTSGAVPKSASFTPAANEVVFGCDCTAGNIIVTLPDASTIPRKIYVIKKIDTSTNIVSIIPAVGFIEGGTYVNLRAVNHAVVLVASIVSNHWSALAATGGGGGWIELAPAATLAPNARYGWDFEFSCTLNQATTLNGPLEGADGQVVAFKLKQDATGGRTINLPAGAGQFVIPSDITVTLSTAANTTDLLTAVYIKSADRWLVSGFIKGATGI